MNQCEHTTRGSEPGVGQGAASWAQGMWHATSDEPPKDLLRQLWGPRNGQLTYTQGQAKSSMS